MTTCMCGNPIDTIGTTCSRCGALQTLGLDMSASAEQIENAHTTLVKVWHPDRFQSDEKMKNAAEEKLKEINAAYDYLAGKVKFQGPTPSPARKPPVSEEFEDFSAPTSFVAPEAADEEEPEEVRRVMKRLQKRSQPKRLINVMFVLGGLALFGLLGFSADLILSTNSSTSRSYEQFKAEISHDLHAKGLAPSSGTTEPAKDANGDSAPGQPVAAEGPAPVPAAKAAGGDATHAGAAKTSHGVKPYVTSGLTPSEVLAILGNPTSSSGEKMFYKGSEIDFRNGQVSGWKIDTKNAPIRVKLWPTAAPVPGVSSFSVGSSKSDVIALQGTPTLFSDNQFGYGNSMVFFQNDRVTAWKEDPASVRLRVVAH